MSTHSSPEGAETELESVGNRAQESFLTSNNVLFLYVPLCPRVSNVFVIFAVEFSNKTLSESWTLLFVTPAIG